MKVGLLFHCIMVYFTFKFVLINYLLYFSFQKAMKDKDIDIEELRQYHSEKLGSKDEPLTK